jgi:hypothetical protein
MFSSGTPVSSTNKTYCQDITEILLKVVLINITLTLTHYHRWQGYTTGAFKTSQRIFMVQTSLQLKIFLTDGLIHVVILNTVKSITKKVNLDLHLKIYR